MIILPEVFATKLIPGIFPSKNNTATTKYTIEWEKMPKMERMTPFF